MEFNPLDFDDHLQGDSGRGRSYTCAFCKRGFSNAQALGGHMNIHRRDRARIRQAAADSEKEEDQQQQLSLDLSAGSPAGPSHDHRQHHHHHQDKATTSSGKRPGSEEAVTGVATRDIDPGTEEVQRVTLSLDAKIGEEKTGSSGGGGGGSSSGKAELVDLELRLGPEPHDTTSKKITRSGFY